MEKPPCSVLSSQTISMKTASCKAKGRNLQNWVVKQVLLNGLGLTENDVRSCSMGSQGADVKLSEAALKQFPLEIECKSHAKHAVYTYLEQASKHGPQEPLAVLKANHKNPVVCVDAAYFFSLVRRANGN